MKTSDVFVPGVGTVLLPGADAQSAPIRNRHIATRDPEAVRAWARRHGAEPATGEATDSGPATIDVNDGGVGIRFNFPGLGRFRNISWDEWFAHFEQHHLIFVYEEEVPDRAYALWQARGAEDGGDRRDWFEAERQLRQMPDRPSARYWFWQQGVAGS